MSATVTIVLHHARTDTALLEEVLAEQGWEPRLCRLYAGESCPEPDGLAGLVVLGGPMGAYEADRYPMLHDSVRLLERAIEADVPTLAICLGAQLLALVAGGTVQPGDAGQEWGFVSIALTDAGRADPLVAGMAGQHFSFHSDSFRLPAGVDVLAESPTYPQAFRVGSALGLQFHPELSVAGMHRLLDLLDGGASGESVQRAGTAASERRAVTRHTLSTLLARLTEPRIADDRHHPGGQDGSTRIRHKERTVDLCAGGGRRSVG
jgi:GMP synthase (glutamine-hydrolysing)